MNEEHRQMKNNDKMKIKNEMKINNNKKPPRRFSQAKYHGCEFLTFDFKKNYYTSVIGITFISNIVFHVVVISTFNKDNG